MNTPKAAQLKQMREQIRKLEIEANTLETEIREEQRTNLRVTEGVKVVCPECNGTGEDGCTSDQPPMPLTCDRCNGHGYLWAVKYDGRGNYVNVVEVISEV